MHVERALRVGDFAGERLHWAEHNIGGYTVVANERLAASGQHSEFHVHAFVVLAADDGAHHLVITGFHRRTRGNFLCTGL